MISGAKERRKVDKMKRMYYADRLGDPVVPKAGRGVVAREDRLACPAGGGGGQARDASQIDQLRKAIDVQVPAVQTPTPPGDAAGPRWRSGGCTGLN